ncbi:MAG: glycosyltransferase family A protein [Desulfoferrobacter sp.]
MNIEKWRVLLVDLPRFLWAMRPGLLSGRFDHPWVYYRQWGEHLVWERDHRGINSSIGGPNILGVSSMFPGLASLMMKRCLQDWPILFEACPLHNENSTKVSFVIPYRGRERLPLLMSVLKSLAAQEGETIECIVVEQSCRPEIKEELPRWIRYIHTPIGRPDMPFNRSWALNVGAAQAEGEILVLLDGDTCVPKCYARELRTIHSQGFKVMRLTRFCFMLDKQSSEMLCKCLDFSRKYKVSGMMIQNMGRTLAVDREVYFELGGHDESFIGWGGEDDEFAQRCNLVRQYPYCYLPMVHLYHPVNENTDAHQRCNAKRLEALQKIPPELRVALLKRKPFGRTSGTSTGKDGCPEIEEPFFERIGARPT